MQRLARKGLLVTLLISSITLLLFTVSFYQFCTNPLLKTTQSNQIKSTQQPVTVLVYPGMSVQRFIAALKKRNLLSHPFYFECLIIIKKARYHMKSGEYLLTAKTTPLQLINDIVRGHVYMRKITFIEGWTFNSIKSKLKENPYIKHELNHKTDQEIMLSIAKKPIYPEGWFFPDTYKYTWGNTDQLILKLAYMRMQRFLTHEWSKRDPKLPYHTPYQALIVASMIEHETALNREKPIIAGVILNRWHQGMRLQIDPTVLYGVGKTYREPITRFDLLDQNPYNTYRHVGLPPTPIGMPSASSILAALHPQQTPYLFYVAKGDGSHKFSTTYSLHRAAVTQYRQQQLQKKQLKQDIPTMPSLDKQYDYNNYLFSNRNRIISIQPKYNAPICPF